MIADNFSPGDWIAIIGSLSAAAVAIITALHQDKANQSTKDKLDAMHEDIKK